MPTGNVKVEEFRESVREEYGREIADEFLRKLGTTAVSIPYSHAMRVLDLVLAKFAVPTYAGPTTSRGDVHLVT
jgi:hypothetical protein